MGFNSGLKGLKYTVQCLFIALFIYVFVCSLFACTVSNREHVVLNEVIVNNELRKKYGR
jgi:uncharacterized membrane protein